MRHSFLAASCLGSCLFLTGCATGLQAEPVAAAPVSLPQNFETVRIRILYTKTPVTLDCRGSWRFTARRGGGKLYSSDRALRVKASRGTMHVGSVSIKGDVAAMPTDPSDSLTLNGRRFRGILVFHPTGNGRYDVVEHLKLEEYLYGVLPKEVEASWIADALKAQAVVSRTYAVNSKLTSGNERFDMSNSVMDQVYGGQHVEKPETTAAVKETYGEILVDTGGKPVQAFFHSSCGGGTERPEYVWKAAHPADVFDTVSDEDYCADDPHYKWQLTLGFGVIRDRLRRSKVNVKDVRGVGIAKKSPSGRVEVFRIETSRGTVNVPGNKMRLALGPEALRSTLLTTIKNGKRSVYFEGRGWGHGVGLCQWGARGRALAGQSYKRILKDYYPKAKLVSQTNTR